MAATAAIRYMTLMTPSPALLSGRDADHDLPDAAEGWANAVAPALAATETGRLVSLAFTVAAERFGRLSAPGAPCQWLAPELALHGSGAAIRLDETASGTFRDALGHWTVLGSGAMPPVGFFTVPPPNSSDSPAVWIPEVVIRQDGETLSLFLTTRRSGGVSAAAVIERWLAQLRAMLAPPVPEGGGQILSRTASPDAGQWAERVRATTQAIALGRFDKVVLARRLHLRMSRPPAVSALARRLAAVNPDCRTFVLPHGRGAVIASSPEILASKRGARVTAHALAGSAKRHDGEAESRAAAARLLASAKERHEHDLVVTAIAAQLRSLCDAVQVPAEPMVMALRFVQHLWTPVGGTLKPRVGLLDVVQDLHPTPAVLGVPRAAAARWLDHLGERRDGLYSGVAGWIDHAGDGDAAMVLRSAFIEGRNVILWAGAGIMAASQPEAEFAETEMKLATMLDVL